MPQTPFQPGHGRANLFGKTVLQSRKTTLRFQHKHEPTILAIAFFPSVFTGKRYGNSVDTSLQVAAAVRAKFVGGIHAALALRADGVQPAPASGTKTKPGFDSRTALRTVQDAWLAQNKIQDDAERMRDKNC
jgi:hypothetical protein